MLEINKIHQGNALKLLKQLDSESINCCITSPPYYGLRDYGIEPTKWPEVSFSPMPGLPKITIPRITCCLGLEEDLWAFIGHIVLIFRGVKKALKQDGTLWLNFGDSYSTGGRGYNNRPNSSKNTFNQDMKWKAAPAGVKRKELLGIPWRIAFALQADGWYLRQDIIWHKPNPMPESVTDRCTKAHEYMFLLSKSAKYYCDMGAIKELVGIKGNTKIKVPTGWETGKGSHGSFHKEGRNSEVKYTNKKNLGGGSGFKGHSGNKKANGELFCPDGLRNKRSVWTIATKSFKQAHFATFPPKLIEPCVRAGCPKKGIILDLFIGSGTTGFVAIENNRNFIGFEMDGECIEKIANPRISQAQPELF